VNVWPQQLENSSNSAKRRGERVLRECLVLLLVEDKGDDEDEDDTEDKDRTTIATNIFSKLVSAGW
jgi:hypothetical protein